MKFSARTIASFLKGEIEGNPDVEVSGVSKIEEGRPGTLSFLSNPKYTPYIYQTEASIVLVNRTFVPEKPVKATLIKVDNAYEAFASLLDMVAAQMMPVKKGKEDLCYISKKAQIGKDCYIGAFAYIADGARIGNGVKIYPGCYIGDNVEIGDNTILYAGVKIYHSCRIGKDCTIHAGAVIGADGFGFAPQTADHTYKKIPQIGIVVIENNVEIGANATIDRATMGTTLIRKGVKMDNMVHIAHNVEVGENTVMAAQTGIAGSSKIGSNCMFGGQVGVAPHVTVASGVKLGAQTGVHNSITEENAAMIGSPVENFRDFMKQQVLIRRLPELNKKVEQLMKEIEELKAKLKEK